MKTFYLYFIFISILFLGCGQSGVEVDNTSLSSSSTDMQSADSTNSNLLDNIHQYNPSDTSTEGTSSVSATSSTGNSSDTNSGISSGTDFSSSSISIPASLTLENYQVLSSLNNLELISVGADGYRIVQYKSDGSAGVLAVGLNGGSSWEGTPSNTYYIYQSSWQDKDASLTQKSSAWSVYTTDYMTEESGSPTSYKEFITTNSSGIFWVDYGQITMSSGGGGGGMGPGSGTGGFLGREAISQIPDSVVSTTPAGQLLFKGWNSTNIDTITAASTEYISRPVASANHLVFVQYIDSIGQITLLDLATKSTTVIDPQPYHQDRPAIHGDNVVWEESLSDENTVIKSWNISTGQVRVLSSNTGFRTNPDILNDIVVWEDQRTGDGDIWFYDLSKSEGEQILISGAGHSAGVRLTPQGIVWLESSGGEMGMVSADWK